MIREEGLPRVAPGQDLGLQVPRGILRRTHMPDTVRGITDFLDEGLNTHGFE